MPRPKRADEAGAIYHALNRGNARNTIFHKEADYEAFERILAEGLSRYEVDLFSYQLMPNHWHRGLAPRNVTPMPAYTTRWTEFALARRFRIGPPPPRDSLIASVELAPNGIWRL